MRILVALVSGALFGIGLTLSDMIDPARVLGFLDVASGAWDPTLAFVMGGAMIPMIVAWRLAGRAFPKPALALRFPARPAAVLDAKLLGGAVMFGAGWGLVGFCPGPALAAVSLELWTVWVFLGAMAVGMTIQRMWTASAR